MKNNTKTMGISGSQNTVTSTYQTTPPTLSTIDHLFAKFALLYGTAWTKELKDNKWSSGLKNEWLKNLRDCNVSQITRALHDLQKGEYHTHQKYPPNLIEFKKICKSYSWVPSPTDQNVHYSILKDWRDIMIDDLIEKRGGVDKNLVNEAKQSGYPLRFLLKKVNIRFKAY